MSFFTTFLKKLSPFHSVPDTVLFQKYLKPLRLNHYELPYGIDFDGTTYWFNTLDLINKSNFHFKTNKDYLFFRNYMQKKIVNLNYQNIEINSSQTKEEIIDILTQIQNHQVTVALLLDKHSSYSVKEVPQLNLPFKNVIILDFIDFYNKIGMINVQELLLPLVKFGSKCGIGVSVVGNPKDISVSILPELTNTFESSGQSFYLNSKPFDDVITKFNQTMVQLNNLSYFSSSRVNIQDDKQYKNSGLIDEGVFVFYDHPDYRKPQTYEEHMREFNMEITHGTYGKYSYAYCLKKNEDKLIVMEPISQKIGYIEEDKKYKLGRARITINEPKPLIDYSKRY